MSDKDLTPAQYSVSTTFDVGEKRPENKTFSNALDGARKRGLEPPVQKSKPDDRLPGDKMDVIDHVVDGVEEIGHVGWETITGTWHLARGAIRFREDMSVQGHVWDLVRDNTALEIPEYFPSRKRGLETAIQTGETAITVTEAVIANPRILIAEYEDMLNKHLYGAFIGAIIVEVADIFFGSHGAGKAGKVMRLIARLEDPARFARLTGELSEVRKLLKANPDKAEATLAELRTTLDAIDPDKLTYGGQKSWEHLKQQLSGAVDDISDELPSHVLPVMERKEGGLLLKFREGSEGAPVIKRVQGAEQPTGEYTYRRNPDFPDPVIRNKTIGYIAGEIELRGDDLARALQSGNFPDPDRWTRTIRQIRDDLDRLLERCRSHHFPRRVFRDDASVRVHRMDVDYSKLTDTEKVFHMGQDLRSIQATTQHLRTFVDEIVPKTNLSPALDSFLEELRDNLGTIESRMIDDLVELSGK